MAQSNPLQKLQFFAPNQCAQHCLLFPQIWRNTKGSHARSTAGSMLHQEGTYQFYATYTPAQRKQDFWFGSTNWNTLDRIGHFPHVSSLSNKHIMVNHNGDSFLSLVEASKNNSGNKLIHKHTPDLKCMQKAGIVPKDQFWTIKHRRPTKQLSMTQTWPNNLFPPRTINAT